MPILRGFPRCIAARMRAATMRRTIRQSAFGDVRECSRSTDRPDAARAHCATLALASHVHKLLLRQSQHAIGNIHNEMLRQVLAWSSSSAHTCT